ncbi:transporter substrate-binding domain-containing protein [Nonomuraea polychroma]|uniref:transporter substrate-binding domain-containing protein n=1 Tax=Nonomuraea polychroma TaxID=46176 RepID=UPI0013E2CD44
MRADRVDPHFHHGRRASRGSVEEVRGGRQAGHQADPVRSGHCRAAGTGARPVAGIRDHERDRRLLHGQKPGLFAFAGESFDKIKAGIAVRKGNAPLRSALAKALHEIRADGTYDKILAKWNLQMNRLEP